MAQHEAVVQGSVTDGAFLEPMGVGATQAHRQHPEQCLPLGWLADRQLNVFEGADAGEPDRGCGGVCDQEAESTAGLTTSASLSMVFRS